jgi:hypothetical protein
MLSICKKIVEKCVRILSKNGQNSDKNRQIFYKYLSELLAEGIESTF